jgi:hypothetical protein
MGADMRNLGRVLTLTLLLAATATYAQSTAWFTQDLELVFARQFASRLARLDGVPRDEASSLSSARRSVQGLARILGSWKDAEAVERAPLFPELQLPLSNQRHIDAMARYQVCSLVLLNQFETGTDAKTRRIAAFGTTAMSMAVERLRLPFMATGRTDRTLNAFLTSPPMVSAFDDIRKKPELAAYAERQCAPLLQQLLAAPMSQLALRALLEKPTDV